MIIDGYDLEDPNHPDYAFFLWLMSRIYHANLLFDFGQHLATVSEAYARRRTIDENLSSVLPKHVKPVYAFHPGNRKSSPKLQVYIGYSLRNLKIHSDHGMTCTNSLECKQRKKPSCRKK